MLATITGGAGVDEHYINCDEAETISRTIT